MDFLAGQALLYTSKKYEEIYFHLNQKYEIKYQDLFLLCATLGFKKNRKASIGERGRELRTNYLNTRQKATVYSIILSDEELGRNIEAFDEDDGFPKKARKRLEEYAEGGMEILVEEVFGHRWDGHKLDETYTEYEVDLLSYVYADSCEVPF
ncbi:hypothetical protein JK635_12490 [Neobacillus sp. YIM B02564]|uniref:Uncharacterized protein n=1 Tax=Neobacillus paridis TaxID=2803862 RepID=A0ABS1TP37_9BACI|nr:hypothetical protein [Neobacillus paridis]MBL4953032.1 hypothetical protein [Neobacillus paridis]